MLEKSSIPLVGELAGILSFLRTFAPQLDLQDPFASEDLVEALLQPPATETHSSTRIVPSTPLLLVNIHRQLLALLTNRKSPVPEDRWESLLRDVLQKRIRKESFIPAEMTFEELWPEKNYCDLSFHSKTRILSNLCDFCCEKSSVILETVETQLFDPDAPQITWSSPGLCVRNEAIDTDSEGNSYWYFDPAVKVPSHAVFKTTADGEIEFAALTQQELEEFITSMAEEEGMQVFYSMILPPLRRKQKNVLARQQMYLRAMGYAEDRPRRRAAKAEVKYTFNEDSGSDSEDKIYYEEPKEEEMEEIEENEKDEIIRNQVLEKNLDENAMKVEARSPGASGDVLLDPRVIAAIHLSAASHQAEVKAETHKVNSNLDNVLTSIPAMPVIPTAMTSPIPAVNHPYLCPSPRVMPTPIGSLNTGVFEPTLTKEVASSSFSLSGSTK